MIRCACLLEIKNDAIMLVRVRDNELWYLPGGTIETNETPEQTLMRELDEELNIQIIETTICPLCVVIGPALGREGDVELNCFRADWRGNIEPKAEVSEVSFINVTEVDKMAPAVQILVNQINLEKQYDPEAAACQ